MKNIFKNRYNKNNPFSGKDEGKGDDSKAMADEINGEEIIEEQSEQDLQTEQVSEETAAEGAAAEPESEKTEIEKLQEKYEALNNQYIRLAADFENYRKRQQQEREALISFGAQECLKKILEVSDNFDRAAEMISKIDSIEKFKETFDVLNKQLEAALAKMGLERIKCAGEKFDPALHEAVMQIPTDEYPEETIIQELQKGYKYGDKVLRPAMVSAAVKKQ